MTNPDPREKRGARGSAYGELQLQGRWALSILTEGWTAKEVERLHRGDDEAREAVKDALIQRICSEPDDLDLLTFELSIASPDPEAVSE